MVRMVLREGPEAGFGGGVRRRGSEATTGWDEATAHLAMEVASGKGGCSRGSYGPATLRTGGHPTRAAHEETGAAFGTQC